ncbi:hypothetical protein IV203_013891 [Nitzschia inconspicua]|uniref:Uncharacterized protein n=1 Tax=Nitzschia inconspicua TaxID=303405 RepID=A0A9K3M7S1_9STRA|nr:hypothetical protein IV203_013891 [Nitzschia inconspicua]
MDTTSRLVFFYGVILQLVLIFESTTAFSIYISRQIQIKPAPLIGGPSWLPLHCQVIVDQCNVFDFVPLDATNPIVLQKLITFQAVPAIARIRTKNSTGNGNELVDRAVSFCQDYNKELHLLNNNCWTFAYDLVSCMTLEEDSQ